MTTQEKMVLWGQVYASAFSTIDAWRMKGNEHMIVDHREFAEKEAYAAVRRAELAEEVYHAGRD